MVQIAVNTRFKSQKITGAQRYAREVSRRFQQPFREIAPPRSTGGVRGRLWEQTELPLLCRSDLLWSPINLGPIARRRQVVTMHDVSPIEHPEWFDRSYSSWYRWLMPRVARRVQHVITDSEYTRQRVISLTGAEPSRVTAIPLGADQTFSKRAPAEIEKVKSRFGIQSRHYLLSLCTLSQGRT